MGSSAIREWQRGVVAIGVRKPNLPSSILNGTGFIVDLQAGLIVTCAHVVLGNFYDFAIGEDSGTGGLAIGVGGIHDGKQIEWRGRAELRYISRQPPTTRAGADATRPTGRSLRRSSGHFRTFARTVVRT